MTHRRYRIPVERVGPSGATLLADAWAELVAEVGSCSMDRRWCARHQTSVASLCAVRCSTGDALHVLASALADARVELDRHRRWKREALVVLHGWEAVWTAAGCPGRLGQSKSDAVAEVLRHLPWSVLPSRPTLESGVSGSPQPDGGEP